MAQFDALPESERSYWIADWQIGREECLDCARPIEECSDPDRRWYTFRRVCYATMEREAAAAAYEALHEDHQYHDGTFQNWSNKRSRDYPYHVMSGVKFGATDTDVAPWDKFTTDEHASPVRPKDDGESALKGA